MTIDIKYEGSYFVAVMGVWVAQGKTLAECLQRFAQFVGEDIFLSTMESP